MTISNEQIDGLLRQHRPDRYGPGDDWTASVVEQVEDRITVMEAKRIAAATLVGQREGQATRRTNRFLKGVLGRNGQYALPLDWHLYADEPVAFVHREGDAEIRVRVALRAMKAQDWIDFAEAGRAELEIRVQAERAMYDAADWLAGQQGPLNFAAWATGLAAGAA